MSLYIKLALLIIIFGGLIGTILYEHHTGYSEGYATAKVKYVAAEQSAVAAQKDKLVAAQDLLYALQTTDAAQLAVVKTQAPLQVATVTRIIHEHPHFAAIPMPPALEQLRYNQLSAIAKAAGSTLAAPAGVATVPAPGH